MPNWCVNKLDITGSDQEVEQIEKLLLNDAGLLDFNVIVQIPRALYGIFTNDIEKGMGVEDENPDRLGKLNPAEFTDKLAELQKAHPGEAFTKEDIKTLIDNSAVLQSGKPVEESIVEAANVWRALSAEERESGTYPLSEDVIVFMMSAMRIENTLHCKALCGYTDWYEWCLDHWGTKWNVHVTAEDRVRGNGHAAYHFDTAWGHPEAWFYTLVERIKDEMPDNTATLSLNFAEDGMWFGGSLTVDEDGFIIEDTYNDEEICEFLSIDYDSMFNNNDDDEEPAENNK